MAVYFEDIFRSGVPARDKYLARLFALFSEQIVRLWCARDDTPYDDLGRPTLYPTAAAKPWHTLDFTLRRRASDRIYVGELKCELEFDNFKYLRLTESWQLHNHLKKPAFQAFVAAARAPSTMSVRCSGKPITIDGAILIWGAITEHGREATMAEHGFADVLCLETMVANLQEWKDEEWAELLHHHRGWSNDLFEALGATR